MSLSEVNADDLLFFGNEQCLQLFLAVTVTSSVLNCQRMNFSKL